MGEGGGGGVRVGTGYKTCIAGPYEHYWCRLERTLAATGPLIHDLMKARQAPWLERIIPLHFLAFNAKKSKTGDVLDDIRRQRERVHSSISVALCVILQPMPVGQRHVNNNNVVKWGTGVDPGIAKAAGDWHLAWQMATDQMAGKLQS